MTLNEFKFDMMILRLYQVVITPDNEETEFPPCVTFQRPYEFLAFNGRHFQLLSLSQNQWIGLVDRFIRFGILKE